MEESLKVKGKIHIQFSVSEPETERYVTFSDDVWPCDLNEWFARAGLGVEQLFRFPQSFVISLDHNELVAKKLMCIKYLKMFTNCSLKDAKDLVERNSLLVPASGMLFLCKNVDNKEIDQILTKFATIDVKVTAKPVGLNVLVFDKIPIFDPKSITKYTW